MPEIECKEVIITSLERRGKGIETDPVRRVTQVYEKTGELIAENDPFKERFSFEDMRQFATYCLAHASPERITIETVIKWDKTNF